MTTQCYALPAAVPAAVGRSRWQGKITGDCLPESRVRTLALTEYRKKVLREISEWVASVMPLYATPQPTPTLLLYHCV